MRLLVKKQIGILAFLILSVLSFSAVADDLVKQIQQDLNTLGYDVGSPDGKMGVKTQMAIGKFQKSQGLAVDGKASIGTAIAISEVKESGHTQVSSNPEQSTTTSVGQPRTLEEQEACLKQKAEEAQAQETSGMFGALTDMAGTMLSSFGQHELATMLGQAKTVAQQAETVTQLSKDLGLNEQQVAECLGTLAAK